MLRANQWIEGPIVNSDDLADALEDEQIYGAGLDVITGEPHIPNSHRLVKASNCECCSKMIFIRKKLISRRNITTYGIGRYRH